MFDINHPILFIDVSYLVFYRYFALRNWFNKAHQDLVNGNKDYPYLENDIFIQKYKKLFFEKILKICKKNKIALSNLVFAYDSPCRNVWRMNYLESYKGKRKDSHLACHFTDYSIFDLVKNELIPNFCQEHEALQYQHPNLEADDVIALFVLELQKKHHSKNYQLFILASDTDYVQLCDGKTILMDLKMNIISCKKLADDFNKEDYLIQKILLGDTSDNIKGVFLETKVLVEHGLIKEPKTEKKYTKMTKKLVQKIMDNTDCYTRIKKLIEFNRKKRGKQIDLEKEIKLDFSEMNQFTRNQILIDFKMIPIKFDSLIKL